MNTRVTPWIFPEFSPYLLHYFRHNSSRFSSFRDRTGPWVCWRSFSQVVRFSRALASQRRNEKSDYLFGEDIHAMSNRFAAAQDRPMTATSPTTTETPALTQKAMARLDRSQRSRG